MNYDILAWIQVDDMENEDEAVAKVRAELANISLPYEIHDAVEINDDNYMEAE
jgi:hypothetical protein